jgi:hypothetical protein
MLHRPIIRILLSLLCSFTAMSAVYLMQTRLPSAGPHTALEDHWLYRLANGTIPPEGQRGAGFITYTVVSFIISTIILYALFTRWSRRTRVKSEV